MVQSLASHKEIRDVPQMTASSCDFVIPLMAVSSKEPDAFGRLPGTC
jgi:hypothetical protein